MITIHDIKKHEQVDGTISRNKIICKDRIIKALNHVLDLRTNVYYRPYVIETETSKTIKIINV